MNTSQFQIGNVYNAMPAFQSVGLSEDLIRNQKSFIDEINNQGHAEVQIHENYLESYIFEADVTPEGMQFSYKHEGSGLVFVISLKLKSDLSGGEFSLQAQEPTIEAGVISSRLWYLFINAQHHNIKLPGGKSYNLILNSLSDEDKRKLLFRATVFRKFLFIEKCLAAKLTEKIILPKEINNNEIGLIDTIFRGITRGNVYTRGNRVSTSKAPPFEVDPKQIANQKAGAFSFDIQGLNLFNYQLPLGLIRVILSYAMAFVNEKENGEVELSFQTLNNQVIFHFAEYINNLNHQQILLEQFKHELSQTEPKELVDLVDLPLLGDVSSIEAGEIVTGWLIANIETSFRPSMKVERSELDKSGTYWAVDVTIVGNELKGEEAHVATTISFQVDRATGRILQGVTKDELKKRIIYLQSIASKKELGSLSNNQRLQEGEYR